jgi:hypothetical protein
MRIRRIQIPIPLIRSYLIDELFYCHTFSDLISELRGQVDGLLVDYESPIIWIDPIIPQEEHTKHDHKDARDDIEVLVPTHEYIEHVGQGLIGEPDALERLMGRYTYKDKRELCPREPLC